MINTSAINNYLDSFKNNDNGWSRRKCMAYFAMMNAAYLSMKHTDDNNFYAVLVTWLVFGGLLIGIIAVADIIKFKNGGGTYPTTENKVG